MELVITGGDPLQDCPKNWTEASAWTEKANKENNGKLAGAKWEYDSGFKLDLDGSLLSVSSRFYPPKTNYGETWDGKVTIFVGEHEICEKSFDCKDLDRLRQEVESYLISIIEKIRSVF